MLSFYDLYITFNKPSVGSPKDQAASNTFAMACHVMRTLPNDEEDNQYGYHYVADALYQVTGNYADLKDIADYYKLAKLDPIGAIAIVQPDGFILNNVVKVSEEDRDHMRRVFNIVYSIQLDIEAQAVLRDEAARGKKDAEQSKVEVSFERK